MPLFNGTRPQNRTKKTKKKLARPALVIVILRKLCHRTASSVVSPSRLLTSPHAALCPALRSGSSHHKKAGKAQARRQILPGTARANRLSRRDISFGRHLPRVL